MDVLQRMCRLCSLDLHNPRDIFTTRGLLDKISKFTDIQIRKGDGLPSSICDLCDIKLQITDEFRQQVGRADNLIRALALKQTAELNESRKTASGQNCVPEKFENENYSTQGFRPQRNRRSGIRRERMRLSERRSWRMKFTQNADLRMKISEKSLIYSYAAARSLVASYKALIDRCRAQGFFEDFELPSSAVASDTESEDEMDERAARFATARRRLGENRKTHEFSASKIAERNAPSFGPDSPERGLQDAVSPRVPGDPLNLLRVKSVRPLVDEDCDVSSEDTSNVPRAPRIESWTREAPGYPGIREDPEDQSSSDCSSSSSDNNFPDEFRSSVCSSGSSVSTVRNNNDRPSSIEFAKNGPNLPGVSEDLQLAAQCPICDRICVNTHGLKVHFRTHRALRCQICQAPTETKERFRDHMQVHVRPLESGSTFKCLVCKNIFKTKIGLNVHMRIHTKSVPAVKECPHCARSFGTLRGFKIHLFRSHSGFETE